MKMKAILSIIIAFMLMSADGCEEFKLIKNIYPNPVQTELNVELETTYLDDYFQIEYEIVNMNGQSIKNGKFENETNSINCSELQPGQYILRILELGESNIFIKK
jgi:Secretion system C-terminal sorting domain